MKDKSSESEPPSDLTVDGARNEPPPEIEAHQLLGKWREATIIHAGERYRLRITSNNRLILTK